MFPTIRRPVPEYRYAKLVPVDRESAVTALAAARVSGVERHNTGAGASGG